MKFQSAAWFPASPNYFFYNKSQNFKLDLVPVGQKQDTNPIFKIHLKVTAYQSEPTGGKKDRDYILTAIMRVHHEGISGLFSVVRP
mgnify:CR=1 FL=1